MFPAATVPRCFNCLYSSLKQTSSPSYVIAFVWLLYDGALLFSCGFEREGKPFYTSVTRAIFIAIRADPDFTRNEIKTVEFGAWWSVSVMPIWLASAPSSTPIRLYRVAVTNWLSQSKDTGIGKHWEETRTGYDLLEKKCSFKRSNHFYMKFMKKWWCLSSGKIFIDQSIVTSSSITFIREQIIIQATMRLRLKTKRHGCLKFFFLVISLPTIAAPGLPFRSTVFAE